MEYLDFSSVITTIRKYISGVPKPCRYFCGRDDELAKAYAKQFKKEYTNILYLTYTGDLKQDIVDMDFADELPIDDDEERFRKHNRFLCTLKEDTLLIMHYSVWLLFLS